MTDHSVLEKTTQMNLLYDFYGALLTSKQQTFFELYYLEDLSLGEIAAQSGVSRQAVFDHLRRGAALLDEYEQKLGLVQKYEQQQSAFSSLMLLMQSASLSDTERKNIENLVGQLMLNEGKEELSDV